MLKPTAFGVTLGFFGFIICGGFMVASILTGFGKPLLDLLGPLHPWYSFSYIGALWMAVFHFIALYILGGLFVVVYNGLAKK
jgi:hypothetical protein